MDWKAVPTEQREHRSGYTEECWVFSFLFFRGQSGSGQDGRMRRRLKSKKNKEMNLREPPAVTTNTRGEKRQLSKCLEVFLCLHFPFCQSVPPP